MSARAARFEIPAGSALYSIAIIRGPVLANDDMGRLTALPNEAVATMVVLVAYLVGSPASDQASLCTSQGSLLMEASRLVSQSSPLLHAEVCRECRSFLGHESALGPGM